MNKSNKRQLDIISILKRDKFVKVRQLSEFTLVESKVTMTLKQEATKL